MTDGASRAWGWVAHLRGGGTTPWGDWSGAAEPGASLLPGAQQLELLRRLNAAGPVPAALAERTLAADPPRRSRPALPLVGGPPAPDHGPRPVAPTELRDEELVELAAVLLAQDLSTRSLAEQRRSRPRPWRIRYRLLGDPEQVAALRRHLRDRGRPEGGVGQVLVLGTDLGRMLTDVWTAQSFALTPVAWPDWIARRAGRGELPRSIRLDRLARAEARLPTTRAVRVVTDPALASRLLGVRRRPWVPQPQMAAAAVDLGRRVSAALRPLAVPGRRSRLVNEILKPPLAGVTGPPLIPPASHRAWVRAEAERLHHELGRARYPVHGDPALVLPVDRAGVEQPDAADALAVAVRMLQSGTLREPPKEGP